MTARNLILLFAALLIAGGSAFFARGLLMSRPPQTVTVAVPAPPKPAQAVLVAKSDLPAGLFVKEEHLRWQPWPSDNVDPNYMIEGKTDMASLVGAVVRRGIAAGEPITASRVVKPGDRGFLAAVLKPGMRAVAIGVDATTGVAGLVFPGDRVDILLTQTLKAEEGEGGKQRKATETVLRNVRILAIDQRVDDQKGAPAVARNATIEVTPKQAEMVAVVDGLGRISLSLISLARTDQDIDDAAVAADAGAAAPGEGRVIPAAEKTTTVSLDDIAEPERGDSYTLDSQASRLISRKVGGRKLSVFHGSKLDTVNLD